MFAEILSTGDEIRSGALIDSNSTYIAGKLETAGVKVVRHSCVGDEVGFLSSILTEIGVRSDVAVVTGGLGPTSDDVTAEAAAKAAGVECVVDETALRWVENAFKTRKRVMSDSNRKQALLPAGAEPLFNPVGTAPGFLLKIGRCFFFFLPGVPVEMRRMLSEAVLPRIVALQGTRREFNRVKTIVTFGLPESVVGERLSGLTDRFPEIKLGLRAKFPQIHVRLYARGRNDCNLEQILYEGAAWVAEKIGDRVISTEGASMEAVIGGLLKRKKATISVAESCTGGLISHMLTNVPGSSDYFLFSAVTYSNRSKTEVLGVSSDTLSRYGAVHETTAKEMAEGARRLGGSAYGLSTSGIAGPDGGTPDKPVGTLCVGLATPSGTEGFRSELSFGDRWRNKEIFAMAALDLLRRELIAHT